MKILFLARIFVKFLKSRGEILNLRGDFLKSREDLKFTEGQGYFHAYFLLSQKTVIFRVFVYGNPLGDF